MSIIEKLKSIATNRLGISIIVGIVVGVIALVTTKKSQEVDEVENNPTKTFFTYFLLSSLLTYAILYVMRRKVAKPSLETVMENVHTGEPKF